MGEISLVRLGWLMLRIGVKTKIAYALGWERFGLRLSTRDVELLCAMRREAHTKPDGVIAAVCRERPSILKWIDANVAGRA